MKRAAMFSLFAASIAIQAAIAFADKAPAARKLAGPQPKELTITSSAFQTGAAIPKDYACDGNDTSPPLAWTAAPAGTQTIAVLVEDPDAPKGIVTHWIVANIPPTTVKLDAGAALPNGAIALKNDHGDRKYMGPCPPDAMHHYHFHVYALDEKLPALETKASFVAAIQGHILAEGDLVGTYDKVVKK